MVSQIQVVRQVYFFLTLVPLVRSTLIFFLRPRSIPLVYDRAGYFVKTQQQCFTLTAAFLVYAILLPSFIGH